MIIVHNTSATNTLSNAIGVARAEIEANKADAQDFFKSACTNVARASQYPANSPSNLYWLGNAKNAHDAAIRCIIRIYNWQAKLDIALAAQAKGNAK
jgi:hypothetical protein